MMSAPLTFTPDARSTLERYIRRVKSTLHSHPSVDVDEVERDIRGHIEAELADGSTPVTEARLRSVLDRLGSPSQWVPDEELPAWRKAVVRLRSGPEDWRLAYVTFALFVAGPAAGPIGPLFFFASIPTARAALALLDQEGEAPGARRWLLYPPLIFLYVTLLLALVTSLPLLVSAAAEPTMRGEFGPWFPQPFWLTLPVTVASSAGIWWMVLGFASLRLQGAVHWIFWPFADWFGSRHAMRIAFVGMTIAALAGAALAAIVWV